jgi:phage terminase large subunit-like protein
MESKVDKAKEIFAANLLAFGKYISPATFYVPFADVHKDIADVFLDDSVKQANIIAPRGIAKTVLVTMAIIHHLFLSPDKGRKVVVIISKTQPHSKSILATIKNIFEFSAGFRKLFGYHGEQNAQAWRDDRVVLSNGDAIIARGTGQPIRGVNSRLQRPTFIILDDPEDEHNTKTVDAMQMNLDWLLQAVLPSVDRHRGRVFVIGTPLHHRCMVSRLSEMSDWKTLHFGNSLEQRLALWPEMCSLQWLKEKHDALRDAGMVRVYYQEHECKLIAGDDAMFKAEDIQYYDKDAKLEWKEELPYLVFPNGLMVAVNVYMGIDPASSVSQSADYSTIVPIAVDGQMNIYVLDYFRKRVLPLDLANAIEEYYHRYHPRLTLIEGTGYQDMLRQYMRTRIFIPGLEYLEKPRDSKSNRLEMMQPFFAQHKVFIKKSMTSLYDELVMFPKAKNDDILDGLYYAMKRIRPASHAPEEQKQRLPEHVEVYVEYFDKKEDENTLPTYFEYFE